MSFVVKQPSGRGQVRIYLAVKRNSRQERTYLGVLDQGRSELLLGKRSPEPDAATLALLSAKGVSYAGRHAAPSGPIPANPLRVRPARVANVLDALARSRTVEVGRVEALRGLATRSGLLGALEAAYGADGARRALEAAMFQACEGEPLYLAEDWAEESGLGGGMSSSTLGRLAEALGADEAGADAFFRAWIEACGKPTALIHDTTSISSYAADMELAEWGYNRDEEALPQVNLALVVARESRLPLWFRVVPGSVPDVATLSLTARTLKALGLKDFFCSLDKGYFSVSNLRALLGAKLGFAIGVPLWNNAQGKALVATNRRALAAAKRSFLYRGGRLRHAEGVYEVAMKDGSVVKLPAHLFLDPDRREASARRLETSVLELERKGSEKPFASRAEAAWWIADNAGKLAKFLAPRGGDGAWRVARKANALAKAMNDFGLTLVLTTKPGQPPEAALDDYRCRDVAEKMFDVCKNSTDGWRLRTGDATTARGRLLLAFLAVTLRCLVESKLREAKLLKTHTVEEALALLRKIKRVQLPDGSSTLQEIPKKARLVAEALGVPLSAPAFQSGAAKQ